MMNEREMEIEGEKRSSVSAKAPWVDPVCSYFVPGSLLRVGFSPD